MIEDQVVLFDEDCELDAKERQIILRRIVAKYKARRKIVRKMTEEEKEDALIQWVASKEKK